MNTFEKARILGDAGRYDGCGPKMCELKVNSGLGGIYHAKAEHKTCRIFKTLMDNNCSFDCKYCANSNRCAKEKASYEPRELATLFNYMHRNLAVHELFLSSAVAGNPDKVTEKMIEAVRILRYEFKFYGYVHFKVLPGVSKELINQAAELASRMSINIEAPSKDILTELSSCKDYKIDILRRQAWISKLDLRGGQTTQMIVNKMATDKDVLRMADWEYRTFRLRRVYYSAFHPVQGTPLQNEKAEPLSRQNHLYNADFLMREYGFKLKEFDAIMEDNLLPNEDPKMALAKATLDSPLDINEASYEDLIRVPGIGPKTAKRILSEGKITKYEQLQQFGARIEKAKPFIEVDGKRQAMLMEF